jgi:hypothetical protein
MKKTFTQQLIQGIKNPFALRKEESGSALIFAIVLTIVTMSIVSLVVAIAVTSLTKTADITKLTYFEMGAQSAISNAMTTVNSPNGTAFLRNHIGVSKSITGTVPAAYSDQGIKWRWYAERINNSSATNSFYIYATGYRTSPTEGLARTFRVTIDSLADTEADYVGGSIRYSPGINAVSQWGIMGISQATLNNGVKVRSYVSDDTLTPETDTGKVTNQAYVASNGNITMGGSSVLVTGLNVLAYKETNPTRCVGNTTVCNATAKNNIPYTMSGEKVRAAVGDKCPAAADSYPTWVASENSGTLGLGSTNGCYNSMIFDINTKIATTYTDSNPLNIYVKGNITVNSGVVVNTGTNPLALRLFSQGGFSAQFNQGTATDPTKFYGILTSNSLVCTDNTTSSTGSASNLLYIYGGIVCDKINFGYGTNLYWDELSGNYIYSGEVSRIWFITNTQEVYS